MTDIERIGALMREVAATEVRRLREHGKHPFVLEAVHRAALTMHVGKAPFVHLATFQYKPHALAAALLPELLALYFACLDNPADGNSEPAGMEAALDAIQGERARVCDRLRTILEAES